MYHRDLLLYRIFLIVFWTVSCFGFVMQQIPALSPLWRPLMLVIDAVMLCLGICTMRRRSTVCLTAVLLALGVVSTLFVNRLGIVTFVNGLRELLPLVISVGVWDYFIKCPHSRHIRRSFEKQARVFLWLQAICITWQFVRFGAGDEGGGTMGLGSSGIASFLIILLSFYIVNRNWDPDNYIKSLRRNWLYIFLMYPTMLNETKASFIIIALYFVLLFRMEAKTMLRMTIAIPAGCLLMWGMATIFIWSVNADSSIISTEFIEEYLTGGDDAERQTEVVQMAVDGVFDDEMGADLPRGVKYVETWPAVATAKGGVWLGAGIGTFKGGTTLDTTAFYKEYEWIFRGTTIGILFIFAQLGILGVIWLFVWLFVAFRPRQNNTYRALPMKLLIAAALGLSIFYNDFIRYWPGMLMAMFLIDAASVADDTPDTDNDGLRVRRGTLNSRTLRQ